MYRNELDKACFTHEVEYSGSKDLAKRTISDKILKDRAYEISTNRNYDGYQRAVASIVYNVMVFFDKKAEWGISVNKQLAEQLHKPVNKKFKRRKVYARFKENIWPADLAQIIFLTAKKIKKCVIKPLRIILMH